MIKESKMEQKSGRESTNIQIKEFKALWELEQEMS